MRGTKYTDEQKYEAVVLARQTSIHNAAKEFSVDHTTINKWTAMMLAQERIIPDKEDHIDPCLAVYNQVQDRLQGNGAQVMMAELNANDPNSHIGFIKEAMNVRGELLKSIKDIGAISTSLKDITDAYKAVNESIRMFSAAIPVGQLESKDDMWQTSQRLIDYRKELEAKETELRKKRLRNIDITPT